MQKEKTVYQSVDEKKFQINELGKELKIDLRFSNLIKLAKGMGMEVTLQEEINLQNMDGVLFLLKFIQTHKTE